MRMAEKSLLLQILDQIWKDHLLHLDHLRQGINLRAYAQRDPLNEYKREAFDLFEAMLANLRQTVTQVLSHLEVRMQQPEPPPRLRPRIQPPRCRSQHQSGRGRWPWPAATSWRSIRPILRPGARYRAMRPAPAARAGSSSSAMGASPEPPSLRAEPVEPIAVALLLAMLATLAVLMVGLVGFFQRRRVQRALRQQLMRARVGLQLLAVMLLGLLFLTQC